MTIQPDLMKAILSMDAYNRGYNAGIQFHDKDQVEGKKIGDAIVTTQSDVGINTPGVNIGFYALVYILVGYKLPNTKPIILKASLKGVTAAYDALLETAN